MGFMTLLQGKRIYLDTNVWVYAIEGYSEYASLLTDLFRFLEQGKYEVFTSELSLAEVLVKPFKDGNAELQQIYKEALSGNDLLSVIPVSRSILLEAAQLRAQTSLKLPDAIHAATA